MIGKSAVLISVTVILAADGNSLSALSAASRTLSNAASESNPGSNSNCTLAWPSLAVAVMDFSPVSEANSASIGPTSTSSASSGEMPSIEVET